MSRRAKVLLAALLRESEDIDYQIRMLDGLKSRLEGFTSNLSPDNLQSVHKPHNDRIGAYTARIVDLEREIELRINKFTEKRNAITDVLLQMKDDRHGDLLYIRYIEGEPWRDVAAALGVSVTWAYTLHNRALKEFEQMFYN